MVKKDLEEPVSTTDALGLRTRIDEVINLGLSAQKCLEYERDDTFEGKAFKVQFDIF